MRKSLGMLQTIVVSALFAGLTLLALQSCNESSKRTSSSDSWKVIYNQAEQFQQEGRLDKAEAALQQALNLAESASADSRALCKSLHALAQLEFNLGNYERAQQLYLKLVSIKQRQGASNNGSLAWNLSELGDAYYWQAKYKQAFDQYQRSAAIYEKDGQLIGLSGSLCKLADTCVKLGDEMQAIPLYNKAYMFAAAAKSNPVFDAYSYLLLDLVAKMSEERAELCKDTGHDQLALKYSVEANNRWKSLAEHTAQPKRPPFPSGRLSEIFLNASRRRKDQTTLLEAAAPDLVQTLETLAYNYCHAGLYGESELLFQRIMDIFNRVSLYNKVLLLDRAEFVSVLYKEWHSCHQTEPLPPANLKQADAKADSAAMPVIDNPYLTEYRSIKHRQDRFEERSNLSQKYCRAIPTHHAIEILQRLQPLVCIGRGVDYWQSMLQKSKNDVTAYEFAYKPGDEHEQPLQSSPGTRILSPGAKEVEAETNRTLVILNPPAKDSIAFESLSKYPGRNLVYIGEPEGLTSADDAFFRLLFKSWKLKEIVALPQWPETYDVMFVYERKSDKS